MAYDGICNVVKLEQFWKVYCQIWLMEVGSDTDCRFELKANAI